MFSRALFRKVTIQYKSQDWRMYVTGPACLAQCGVFLYPLTLATEYCRIGKLIHNLNFNLIMLTAVVSEELKKLLTEKTYLTIPKVGELVSGTVIAISPREIWVDINGFKTGLIRGLELADKDQIYPNLKLGDQIEVTVLELENEEGQVELSLASAGKLRASEAALDAKVQGMTVDAKIMDANRGGLMATWSGMSGFIPVSQLSPEHYPRVPGGDKGKILDRLRSFVGTSMRVKVLDCDPQEDKLIFSEKALWEEEQKDLLIKYKVGDIVEGVITAVADFGAFVGFDGLEGLVHISEIAWQRIDNPADLVKVGDRVRAKILNIQGSKIFLSAKALLDDPWKKVGERYVVGQMVNGRVLKVNPFGVFVELDPEIHGLAHISELNITAGLPLEQQIKPGDTRTFKVVSIEPEYHRLGLSEKKGREIVEETPPKLASSTPENSAAQESVV